MKIIDAMGFIIDVNVPGVTIGDGSWRPELAPRALHNAKASGVTALHMTIGHIMGQREPFDLSVDEIAQWDKILLNNEETFVKVKSAADIDEAYATGRIGVIYGFQNSLMLGTEVQRVDLFAAAGVRAIQLTYNRLNNIGSGCLEPDDLGVTPFGRDVITRMNEVGIVVDLSHAGPCTTSESAMHSSSPVAITHTGCSALNNHPRNSTDENLRLVASRGGFVGIYFMPFLVSGRSATGADVVEHIEHAIDVCGEDHVGIGSDTCQTSPDDLPAFKALFAAEIEQRRAQGISAPGEHPDMLPFAVDMHGTNQFRDLIARLERRGHSAARIEKILGGNFLTFLKSVWKS